jgi:hypothetical protein
MPTTSTVTKKMQKAMDSIISWLIEWKIVLECASLLLVTATILTGALTVWAGYEDGKRSARKIAEFNARIADAEKAVALANEGQAKANLLISEASEREAILKKESLALQLKLEAEHKERLALEEAASPRRIRRSGEIAERLKGFPGISVAFEFVDRESLTTAIQIGNAAEAAGWRNLGMERAGRNSLALYKQGVLVEAPRTGGEGSARAAAIALIELLDAEGIEAELWPAPDTAEKNAIKVKIGEQPWGYTRTEQQKKSDAELRAKMLKALKDSLLQPAKSADTPGVQPEPKPDNP